MTNLFNDEEIKVDANIDIILLGDKEVGKTLIVDTYLKFPDGFASIDHYGDYDIISIVKKLKNSGKTISLNIYDPHLPKNPEDYEKYLKAINQKFDGGFVVYDVSLKESFNNVD